MAQVPQKTHIICFVSSLILLLATFFLTSAIHAEDVVTTDNIRCVIPAGLKIERPDPPGKPTIIEIAIAVTDVTEIQETNQSFNIDFFGMVNWHDPRLSEEALGHSLEGCVVHYTDIWSPSIVIINARNFSRYFDQTGRVNAQGDVTFLQRLTGVFTARYHLETFPFDTQALPIKIRSADYGPDEVVFYLNETLSSVAEELSLPGWHVTEGERGVQIEAINERGGQKLAGYDYTLTAERMIGYYIWKIFLPLTFIVLMAWTVFWISPENFGAQVAVSTASIFTLIAFLLGVGQLLPELSYLTKLDKLIFAATLMVFCAMGETIVTSQYTKRNQRELALKINRAARIIYPLLFLLAASIILSF